MPRRSPANSTTVGALPFALGGVGWVAAHRAPLEMDDVFADERFHAVEWCRRHGLRSFYAVPLTSEGALLATRCWQPCSTRARSTCS